MSIAPKPLGARQCPACNAAVPIPTLSHCPVCGADLASAGDLGKALVEAMTDVLGDPLGRKRKE